MISNFHGSGKGMLALAVSSSGWSVPRVAGGHARQTHVMDARLAETQIIYLPSIHGTHRIGALLLPTKGSSPSLASCTTFLVDVTVLGDMRCAAALVKGGGQRMDVQSRGGQRSGRVHTPRSLKPGGSEPRLPGAVARMCSFGLASTVRWR